MGGGCGGGNLLAHSRKWDERGGGEMERIKERTFGLTVHDELMNMWSSRWQTLVRLEMHRAVCPVSVCL